VDPAQLERHHEPPRQRLRPGPTWVRVPGLAVRLRVPGRRLQHALAAVVLLLGLGASSAAAVNLLTAHHPRYNLAAKTKAVPVPAPHGSWAAPPAEIAGPRVPPPAFLTIPAIGVRTSLIRLGLTPADTLAPPPTTTVAGWYTGSPAPGAIGTAVIAGHVDSVSGPGVFFRLRQLHPGQRIYVRQAGGRLAVFRVTSVRQYVKARFPTFRVYGAAPTPELRLITCGGTFDFTTGSYLSNVVVYATMLPRTSPAG